MSRAGPASDVPWAVQAMVRVLQDRMPILPPVTARKLAEQLWRAGLDASMAENEQAAAKRRAGEDRARAQREFEEKLRRDQASRPAPSTASGRPAHVVLGVPLHATAEQIKTAWRGRAKRCHPDTGGSTEMMAELNAARDAMLKMAGAAA